MGKRKNPTYNDYLDGEKLSDNSHVRTSLQESSPHEATPLERPQPPLKPQTPKKPPLTHFLSLPLVTPTSTPQLRASLAHLRATVSRTNIPEVAVRHPSSLHLTLGVMALTPSTLEAALEHLASLDVGALLASVTPGCATEKGGIPGDAPTEVDKHGVVVDLKGLKPMPGRGPGTSVLYAEAEEGDEGGRLVKWGEGVRREFGEWMVGGGALRVHCTVLNTIYARGRGRRGEGGRKGPMKFDAKELMEEYKDFVWAEGVRIDRVQICEMGARKVRDGRGEVVDEVYEVVGEKMVGGLGEGEGG